MSSSEGNALAVRAAATELDGLPTAVPFDTIQGRFNPVQVNVEVRATARRFNPAAPRPLEISGEEVISAAGTYGDLLRYLQVLPSVVPTSDASNEALVRGGHPMENLYVVDGFEIPNINHLSRPGSTGGFAPMIDSGLVQRLTMHTGGYGSEFSDRLSSVTEIDLPDTRDARRHFEGDLGIQGIGGLLQTNVHSGDLLVSGHHGLLDAVTKDAGMSGVPSYTNELSRLRCAIERGLGDNCGISRETTATREVRRASVSPKSRF